MSNSTLETGHYKNIAHFRSLIQFCIQLGEAYKPSRTELEIPQLQQKLAMAMSVADRQKIAEAALTVATSNRTTLFADLVRQAARIVNTVALSNPTSGALSAAKHHLAKMRGQRIGEATPAVTTENTDAPPPRKNSISQAGFDARTDHFEKLVHLVATEPAYQPNETELTIASLQIKVQQLHQFNAAVTEASDKLKLCISERQHILYDAVTGLTEVGQSVKKYIKVLYLPNSKEVKAATAFAFRKMK